MSFNRTSRFYVSPQSFDYLPDCINYILMNEMIEPFGVKKNHVMTNLNQMSKHFYFLVVSLILIIFLG